MKQLTLFLALAGACTLSCQRIELQESAPETVRLTITTSSDTKTAIARNGSFYWSSGDALKVFETAGSNFTAYDSAAGATTDGGATMTFAVDLTARSASGYSYCAFYPKKSLHGTPADATAVAINIPSTQTPATLTFDKAADVLISERQGTSSQPSTLQMRFARPVAIGCITLGGLSGTPSVIKFSAVHSGDAVAVAGATTFDLTSAQPVSSYGDAAAASEITLDCSALDPSTFASMVPYESAGFDWDSETVSDYNTAPALMSEGIYFTCWPFELGSGDSFKVTARVGDYVYTKNINVPSGRSFKMPEGGVGSFSVDMSAVTPVYTPDDYLSRWNNGEDLVIAGKTFNKATYGEPTLLSDGDAIAAGTGGVYFVDTGASVTLTGHWSKEIADNLIIIGRTPGDRPTVTQTAAPSYIDAEGKDVALYNIDFATAKVPTFKADAQMGSLSIDDCTVAFGVLYTPGADDCGFDDVAITSSKLALCKEDIQSGNRANGITRGTSNTSMHTFTFTGNVVYPRNETPSQLGFNQDIGSRTCTVDEVVFADNLFVNVAPYTAFADWTNDYKLTVTGNIIDFDGERSEAASNGSTMAELDYFARRTSNVTLTDVTQRGNAMYYSQPSKYCTAVVCQPRSEFNRFPVAVPQESVLVSRDFENGEFPLKSGPLYAEATATDGTVFWGSVDCTNHIIYINHVPRADMLGDDVRIYPESCECSALSGSWPTRSITVDGVSYTVKLPDCVDGSSLSGYTLQWADEFNLDHVDRQAWRNTTSFGGASAVGCPGDNSLADVSNGILNLWQRTTTDSSVGYWPSGASVGYVAGGLDTRYRRDFFMGDNCRMEVRVKWEEMKGLWQAAWMLADPNQGFGTSRNCVGGEMDIIEHLNAESTMYQTLHTENTVTNGTGDTVNCGQARKTSSSHSNTWHTFGVELTGGGTASADMKFYFDGTASSWYKQTYLLSDDVDYSKTHPKSYWSGKTSSYGFGYYWPYDLVEYCMILSAQVGGSWCGDPDGSTSIAAATKGMHVDYVRFYTKD